MQDKLCSMFNDEYSEYPEMIISTPLQHTEFNFIFYFVYNTLPPNSDLLSGIFPRPPRPYHHFLDGPYIISDYFQGIY